jgi:hypothetical protein
MGTTPTPINRAFFATLQSQNKPVLKEKVNPIPQQKINQALNQVPGTTMPRPLPPSFGVNLRITDFVINNEGTKQIYVKC